MSRFPGFPGRGLAVSHWRLIVCILGVAGLAACAGPQHATRDTARYVAQAKASYAPPGPPEDPWGPYIREAATRFDMPHTWIRAVMRAESGGRLYKANGDLITSHAGAMGLMQVMPGTYEELRARHDLGEDPFHPRDNILAGTAYMREMYDIYGSPAFLAAYNAGPARLDDYLTNHRGLPDETRNYVRKIAPSLDREQPSVRSPAEQFAMNQIPTVIPAGLRFGRSGGTQYAAATALTTTPDTPGTNRVAPRRPVEVAQAPEPPRPPATRLAAVEPPAPAPAEPSSGFRLISPANAAPVMAPALGADARRTGGQWAIQVGAFANQAQAQSAVGQARDQARGELSVGKPAIGTVRQGSGLLYRARMTGLSKESATQACEKITRGKMNCVVLSPEAQN
jgi:hypothetical protein